MTHRALEGGYQAGRSEAQFKLSRHRRERVFVIKC